MGMRGAVRAFVCVLPRPEAGREKGEQVDLILDAHTATCYAPVLIFPPLQYFRTH